MEMVSIPESEEALESWKKKKQQKKEEKEKKKRKKHD
jgi:hypothetical protein